MWKNLSVIRTKVLQLTQKIEAMAYWEIRGIRSLRVGGSKPMVDDLVFL